MSFWFATKQQERGNSRTCSSVFGIFFPSVWEIILVIDFGREISFNKTIMVHLYVTRSRVIIIRVQLKDFMHEPFIRKVSFSIDAGLA